MKFFHTLIMSALFSTANAQLGINTVVKPNDPAKVVIANQSTGDATLIFQTTASPISAGQVLVSDAKGNTTWTTLDIHPESIYNSVSVKYANNGVVLLRRANSGTDTPTMPIGANFTVPQGLWQVYICLKINAEASTDNITWRKLKVGESMWVRLVAAQDQDNTTLFATYKNNDYLYDKDPSTWDPPALVSGNVIGPNSNGLLKGEIFIRNCNGSSGRAGSTPTTVRTDPFYLKGVVSILNNGNNGLNFRVNNLGAAPSYNGENRIVPVYMGKCPQ